MPKVWEEALLLRSSTIQAALECIDRTALQIALVVDREGRLQGTLTDGDVRRALLRGASLGNEIGPWMNEHPHILQHGASQSSAMDVMRRLELRSLPIVDDNGRVVGLMTLADGLADAPARDTPVLVMAGGRGARLGHLTDATPKPLVTVAGEPLIDILLRRLCRQGFKDVTISVGYLADLLMEHVGDGSHLGLTISYLVEETPLGTAGAVALMPDCGPSGILVTNADVVSSFDFGALADAHASRRENVTVAVRHHGLEVPFGVVTHRDGRVLSVEEKPVYRLPVSAGVNVVSRQAQRLIPAGGRVDMNELIELAIAAGLEVGMYEVDGYWLDVGTQSSLAQAERDHAGTRTYHEP